MSKIHFVVLAAVASFGVGSANAAMLAIGGDLGATTGATGCDFSGTLSYTAINASLGQLTVTLTNTTAPGIGGFLTAFVFNVDSSGASVLQLSGPNANWGGLAGASANPYGGSFDGGSSTGGSWEGGGMPSRGLAVGATGTWTFDITGVNALALSEQSFVSGPYAHDFVVRFRGLTNGGSDKVPMQVVPTPGAMALAGLAGLAGLRRRRV